MELPESSIQVSDPFTKAIETLPAILGQLQSASIILTPDIYQKAWRNGSSKPLVDWAATLPNLQEILLNEIQAQDSNIVVATHVLPCILALELKKKGLLEKVFGVITDYGAHAFWPVEGVDGYFVGHNDVKNSLIYRGVPEDSIFDTGIPISVAFERTSICENGTQFRLLLLGGGVRSSAYVNIPIFINKLLKILCSRKIVDLAVTVVAGKNEGLTKKLNRLVKKCSFKLDVLGYRSDMPSLLASHDLLITKPGGLIISEALASGIIPLLMKPGPGQEGENESFLARHGVALRGHSPREAAFIVERCIQNPEILTAAKARTIQLGRRDAARKVVDIILDMR